MELPNEGYGYWVLGIGFDDKALCFGPFTDRERAETCLIALVARTDVTSGRTFLGDDPPKPEPSKEPQRATTARR